MRFLITILFFFNLIVASAQAPSLSFASPLEEGHPESVGMNPVRLERISTMLEDAVREQQIPGAVALVARHGKVVYYKAFGTANESGEALRVDHIFRIASQTKAITSTGLMLLWEEGKFKLNDPVHKFIPEFKNMQVLDTVYPSRFTTKPANKPITIRHLLTHTSGIGYGVIDGNPTIKSLFAEAGVIDLATTEPITIAESVKKLATIPLHHNPGERFTYSEGIDVAGYLIEVLSGMPLDEFLRKRLLDPIGMEDTWFYLPEEKYDRLVKVQYTQDGKWTNFPVTFYDPDYPIKGASTFFSGGAGLSSTAWDYASFLQMYLNDGIYANQSVIGPLTIDLIMGAHDDGLLGANRHHGLAFSVTKPEGVLTGTEGSEGTFSWGGYFNTQYFADPQTGVIGVLLKQTQGTSNDETSWKFMQLITQAIEKR
ncbi:MAG: beta-lactamase family protein [Saprospiraceae bacterium]|nr:beta-lactamase family protein [Saprospiraceae bacterium]